MWSFDDVSNDFDKLLQLKPAEMWYGSEFDFPKLDNRLQKKAFLIKFYQNWVNLYILTLRLQHVDNAGVFMAFQKGMEAPRNFLGEDFSLHAMQNSLEVQVQVHQSLT